MKILFIINVHRKGRLPSRALLDGFDSILRASGHEYRIEYSSEIEASRGHIEAAAREGFDTLWVGGGDGTVNVLLNQSFETGMTYGIVPMGTVNALARTLGIPARPLDAAKYLVGARPSSIDVGQVNDRLFMCFASGGFDAAVVHDVALRTKRMFGRLAFVASGVHAARHMGRLDRFEMQAQTSEGKAAVEAGHSFIASNICNYAGFPLFRGVQPCSGNVELYVFRENRVLPMLAWCAAAGLRRGAPAIARGVAHHMVSDFVVRSERGIYLQLDGEPVTFPGETEYRFRCLPSAAKVLMRS